MLAIVSYNKLPKLQILKNRLDMNVHICEQVFNPKEPASVRADDVQFQELLKRTSKLSRIIIFAGKKSSGALEIIELFCSSFHKEKLFFVLCDHDSIDKEQLLESYTIPKEQYLLFSDNSQALNRRCNEEIVLLGLMVDSM